MSWGEAPPPPSYDPNDPNAAPGPPPFPPPFPDPRPSSQGPYPQGFPGQPQAPQPGWAVPRPFGDAPGYVQPVGDPNNPCAQPGYGQPGYPAYPATAPKSGNRALIAIIAGAVVVVGGGVTAAILLTGGHDGNSPVAVASRSAALSAPAGVSGLTRLSSPAADGAVSSMRQSLAAEAAEYPDPLLAAYNDDGAGAVTTILVDEPMDALSPAGQSQLTSIGSASAIVSEIMADAGVDDARTESTAAADGALSCGSKSESGTGVTICVWYDGSTFGTLQYLDGTSPQHAAPVADAVRADAEG